MTGPPQELRPASEKPGPRSEKVEELGLAEACLPEYGAQRAGWEIVPINRDDCLAARIIAVSQEMV